MRVFYDCEAGGKGYECCTMILSKHWGQLHKEFTATGQRWYCKRCGTRYRTKFGVIIEIVIKGVPYYARATFPEGDWLDVKFLAVERAFSGYSSGQALLDALPEVKPLDKGMVLEEVKGMEGVYRYSMKMFAGIPLMEWDNFYNLIRYTAPARL